MSVTNCPSCNTPAPPGAVFCDNCGYDLRTIAQSDQQPVPPTFHIPEDDAGGIICSTCQHSNIAGSAFCENCGAPLSQVQAPPEVSYQPEPEQPVVPPVQPPSAVAPDFLEGSLEIQDSKVTLPIPQGKQTIILGREDPVSGVFPDIDLDPHGGHESGVGRQHARLIMQGGQVHVEDLDSVNGTVVNKQKLVPRQPHPLNDGDELRLGKMIMIFHAS